VQTRPLSSDDSDLLLSVERGVFDEDPRPELVRAFLADPRSHIVAAIEDQAIVGFASALHYVHPDKPAELWINEVAVAPGFRGRGIGKGLMTEILALGRHLDCVTAWALTEEQNRAARALYASAGGTPSTCVMVEFPLSG
jgi:ribosomal protein S18 acetylase RimI-like enzyme